MALAEMALAGGLGASVALGDVPREEDAAIGSGPALLGITQLASCWKFGPSVRAGLTGLFEGLPMGETGLRHLGRR